jgi:elongation factor P
MSLGHWGESSYKPPHPLHLIRRKPTCTGWIGRILKSSFGLKKFKRRLTVVKVIASEVRKGNVLEIDGVLCTVVKAESVRPGKGTPTTHLDVRRISDGVKLNKSYRTTENVERAFLDEKNYNFLYQDDMGYHFMEPETFEQLAISKDLIGDQAQWLQENMVCTLELFEGVPVAITLPAKVTMLLVEAEPAVKGQTASSSFKPGKLENGARVMVPPHISAGIRVVVLTEDGSYVERAKD